MINKAAIGFVRFYQKFISPVTIGSCRYHPSCSEYAVWQFETNGFLRAFFASILRILRCNKLFDGGIEYPTTNFKKPINKLQKNGEPKEIKYFFVPQKNGSFLTIKRIDFRRA